MKQNNLLQNSLTVKICKMTSYTYPYSFRYSVYISLANRSLIQQSGYFRENTLPFTVFEIVTLQYAHSFYLARSIFYDNHIWSCNQHIPNYIQVVQYSQKLLENIKNKIGTSAPGIVCLYQLLHNPVFLRKKYNLLCIKHHFVESG